MLLGVGLVIALSTSLLPHSLHAQIRHDGFGAALGLFGGFIDAARRQAAIEAWARQPEDSRYCLQRALNREGVELDAIIAAGVMPDHPRLVPLHSECRRFSEAALRRNFPCTVPDEAGRDVRSVCNQVFVRRDLDSGPALTWREVIDLHFSGVPIIIREVETAEARRGRIEAEKKQQQSRDLREGLDRLASLRRQAESRTADGLPQPVRGRLTALQAEHTALLKPSRPATPQATPPADIGPSFDCSQASEPATQLICTDPTLRRLDLEFARAYYALRHLFPAQQEAIRNEAAELYRRVPLECRLPGVGALPPDLARPATRCISEAYRKQKELWEGRIARAGSVSAREETNPSIQDHLRLQGDLKSAGFLPADAAVDGVFGSVTRGAIVAFQAAEGMPTDGFMSVAVAERLRRRVGAPSEGDLAYSEDTLAKVNSLADRYVAYLADLDAEESKRKEWAERLAKLREKQGIAERLAAQPVSAELRRFSAKFVGEAKKVNITTAPAVLDRLDDEFAKWQPQIDAGMALVQALTPANRFLFDGAPDDVVFLFNAAESSTVSRGLNGELVFERGGTPACLLHEAAADRFILRQIRGKAKSIRAELKQPFPRCSPETMESSDVLVLQRDLLKRQPAELVVSLANQVHAGRYAWMALLTQAEVRAAAEADARLLRTVLRNLETGDTSGFGIVVVENGSSVACVIVPAGEDLPDGLTKALDGRFADEVGDEPTVLRSSPDDAFLSAKRGRCGAVYANGRDLSALAKGLKRDRVAFRHLAVWLPVEQFGGPSEPDDGDQEQKAPAPAPNVPQPESPVAVSPGGVRVALVIGNSDYSAVPRLLNPGRDAVAVASALRSVGFRTVLTEGDLTRQGMIEALRRFELEAERADWAVVYFAGHGIEVNGVNYLVPVDAKLRSDKDVADETVPLERVLSAVESTKALRLVILDACRDNPFVGQMRRTLASRSVGRGLARAEPEGGTLVAYAAKHGQTAEDGSGSGNSPFVSALVRRLATPGLEINKLFRLVRDDVLATTGKRQEPFTYGSLPGDDFYFSIPR